MTKAPSAHVCTPHQALKAAEAFISGFEDDASQAGVPDLLASVRRAMYLPDGAIVIIKPSVHKWSTGTYAGTSDFGMTSQAHWYRMRQQRENCWPLEPFKTFVRESYYDSNGRLWQRAYPAVTDDFGDLVEVLA